MLETSVDRVDRTQEKLLDVVSTLMTSMGFLVSDRNEHGFILTRGGQKTVVGVRNYANLGGFAQLADLDRAVRWTSSILPYAPVMFFTNGRVNPVHKAHFEKLGYVIIDGEQLPEMCMADIHLYDAAWTVCQMRTR